MKTIFLCVNIEADFMMNQLCSTVSTVQYQSVNDSLHDDNCIWCCFYHFYHLTPFPTCSACMRAWTVWKPTSLQCLCPSPWQKHITSQSPSTAVVRFRQAHLHPGVAAYRLKAGGEHERNNQTAGIRAVTDACRMQNVIRNTAEPDPLLLCPSHRQSYPLSSPWLSETHKQKKKEKKKTRLESLTSEMAVCLNIQTWAYC